MWTLCICDKCCPLKKTYLRFATFNSVTGFVVKIIKKKIIKQWWSSTLPISTKRTITFHLYPLSTKKTTIYDVGNPGPGLGQAQTCSRLNLRMWYHLITIIWVLRQNKSNFPKPDNQCTICYRNVKWLSITDSDLVGGFLRVFKTL